MDRNEEIILSSFSTKQLRKPRASLPETNSVEGKWRKEIHCWGKARRLLLDICQNTSKKNPGTRLELHLNQEET